MTKERLFEFQSKRSPIRFHLPSDFFSTGFTGGPPANARSFAKQFAGLFWKLSLDKHGRCLGCNFVTPGETVSFLIPAVNQAAGEKNCNVHANVGRLHRARKNVTALRRVGAAALAAEMIF